MLGERKYFDAEFYKSIKRHICVTCSCYAFNSYVRKKEKKKVIIPEAI